MRVRSVLIVGGGVAGLSLAIALREKGIAVRIVEERAAGVEEESGLHLPGNAVRAAARLGLEDALRQHAFRIPRIVYTNQDGTTLATLDLTRRYGPIVTWPAFYAVHRASFQKILLERADGIEITYDCQVAGIGSDEHGVGVTLSNGKVLCPDLVVGADGLHSPIRENHFGPQAVPMNMGYRCWRFVAPRPSGLAAPQYMIGNRRAFMIMPIDDDRIYGYGMAVDDDQNAHGDDLSRIFQGFGGFVPAALARLDRTCVLPGILQQVVLEAWSSGRIVLIGDAAHATLPTLAQGAAMAMEDALVLAHHLGTGHGTLDEQLAAFEARRRTRVSWVQEQSARRMRVMAIHGKAMQNVRDFSLRIIGAHVLKSGWAPLIEKPI